MRVITRVMSRALVEAGYEVSVAYDGEDGRGLGWETASRRLASTWYGDETIEIGVKVLNGQAKKVALYL
ncbi:MAG: hypothetical protein O2960_21670 [Verrucomicrobia bacterium]|nr:hypothetical protein [Verrucomicrobiota bacterium]